MPPKKSKRGKGSKKKSNLTVYERNAITRQKMAAEKDQRHRRKRLTKIFLKVKSDKEYALMKFAQQELLAEWRPMMREMRKTELLKEFKLMQSTFERSVDKKNELINELENQLRKNNKDYDAAFDNHMFNMDKMFDFLKRRMMEVKNMYGVKKKELVDTLNSENAHLTDNHIREMKFIKGVQESVADRHKEALNNWKDSLQLEKEQVQNKLMEDGQSATIFYKDKIADLWENIKVRITSYDRTMIPLREEYLKLLEKDDIVSEVISVQHTQTQTLINGLASLTNRMDVLNFAVECYLKGLKEKKVCLRKALDENLRNNRFFVDRGRKAIRVLALTCHSLMSKLDEHNYKRDRLMHIVERCRQNEREDEKVDPFMAQFDVSDVLNHTLDVVNRISTRVLRGSAEETEGESAEYMVNLHEIVHDLSCTCNPCLCELIGEDEIANLNTTPLTRLIHDYSLMEQFWIRCNRCSLEIGVLQEKRNKLAKDNLDLKTTLRNYMGGLNPLDHDPQKLAIKAVEEDKRSVGRIVHQMRVEFNRRERSRKVGGIRMH